MIDLPEPLVVLNAGIFMGLVSMALPAFLFGWAVGAGHVGWWVVGVLVAVLAVLQVGVWIGRRGR